MKVLGVCTFFKRGKVCSFVSLNGVKNELLLLNLIIVTLKSKRWYNVHNVKNPLVLIGSWQADRTKGSLELKYKVKVIVSGNVIEVYRYGLPVRTGKDKTSFERRGTQKASETSEEVVKVNDDKNLKDSLRRTRNTLRRLINANTGKWNEREKFFTLTFKENVTDHEKANAEFRSFIKRLNYKIFKKHSGLKYVCVVERQERGALHYHIVLFNMPFVPVNELSEIWGHGFVRINEIKDVDNLGAYVVKYIEKTMYEMQEKKSAKVKDKKLYFASRGLYKPVEISDGTEKGKEEILNIAAKTKGHEVFRKTYESEYYETFEVIQYNLAREKS